ncbi:hypothetical protein B5G34_06360 [Flavonifractor sp. An82]|uniref:hypothetical protein n=1 Tax=Flavonifractor sp. An82 TaxID=1965660 RepID=UPI000B38D724|nr:hypothetical protein [Flavonifractor sp. An82]OUN22492.1 hypothetical protein B5G34_06360 [Flavonifractor sp. An82]
MLPGTALGSIQEPEEDEQQLQAAVEEPFLAGQKEFIVQREAAPANVGRESLSQGSSTVSGTVSLPGDSTALSDSYLYVYLCTPPVLDPNGRVIAEPVVMESTRVVFSQGQNSGNFIFENVASGLYVLQAYSDISSGSTLGGDCYFNADGTPVSNPYAATALSVGTGTTSVNLALPAAPRSISGIMTFDSAPSEDISFRINCYGDSTASYSSVATLKAGATSADFSIGVGEGQYFIQFRNSDTGAYGVYDIYGAVTTDHRQRMPVGTMDDSVSGLQVDCSSLGGSSGGSGGQPEVEMVPVEVTVRLPEPLAADREYAISLVNEEGYPDDSAIYYVAAGEDSLSAELWAEEGSTFRVAYSDVTGCNLYNFPAAGSRYAAEDGITTQFSKAKVFTGIQNNITLAEPACYTVSGTLSRSGDPLPDQAAYVLAEFNDGEAYAGRAVFASGSTSVSYIIYIPQSQQGNSFHLTAYKAANGTGNQINESTHISGGSYLLSGAVQADLTFPAEVPTIKGTLSLPAGYVAPQDGLVITLGLTEDYNDTVYATYYLPSGHSSLSYSLNAPISDSTEVYAELSSPTEGFFQRASKVFSRGELSQADLAFQETVTISGTITVPEICREGIALISLYAYGDLNGSDSNASANVAIPAGEISTSFTLSLPKSIVLRHMSVRVETDTTNILNTSELYLQSDLSSFSTQYADLSETLGTDLNLEIPLSQGVFVSGTISLAEGLSAGSYSGSILLESVDGASHYSEYFEFTGNSSSYKISLPEEASSQSYYLSIYLHEGEGAVLNRDYYYTGTGLTSDRADAVPVTLGESGATIDFTIPKAKIISGSFVSVDGSPVVWDPEENLRMYLRSGTESEVFRITPDAQGNWSVTVPSNLTGRFILYTCIDSNTQTSIIRDQNYYYSSSPGAATQEDQATPILLTEEDLTGLQLYVETGWLLSGNISLPEDGYIHGGTVDIRVEAESASGNGYYYGSGTVGNTGGSYSVTVPKNAAAQYELTLESVYSLPSEVSSNIYWGEQVLTTPSVSGDTSGLDFTLFTARSVITGTVYRPDEFTDSFDVRIQVLVDRGSSTYSYSTSAYLHSSEDSAAFSISVPQSETAASYQIYYHIYGNIEGILSGPDVYLCADGSLSTDPAQAGTFSLDDPQTHVITPLTAQPFATGRIYCPEGLDQPMTLVLYYSNSNGISTLDWDPTAIEVRIGPNIGQQDEQGRWYSTYSFSGLNAGDTYHLRYYSTDISDIVDTNHHYIKNDGTVVTSISQATTYTVPPVGSNAVDFTPILWNDGCQDYVLQSEHGLQSLSQPLTYTYTYPGATGLRVTFSDRTDMDLTINNTSYVYSSVAGTTITVNGNTLTVKMDAFNYASNTFGFAIEKVEPLDGPQTSTPGAAAVYTTSGSTEAAVLADAKAGEPVRVSLVGQQSGETTHSLLGALYGTDGALLDVVQVPVTFNSAGVCTTSLRFDAYDQAVSMKLFLVDQKWAPEMQEVSFDQMP